MMLLTMTRSSLCTKHIGLSRKGSSYVYRCCGKGLGFRPFYCLTFGESRDSWVYINARVLIGLVGPHFNCFQFHIMKIFKFKVHYKKSTNSLYKTFKCLGSLQNITEGIDNHICVA